jgi:hypothetical protein
MVAAVNYEIGGPTSGHPGGTWTIQNTNSATVGRYHDLAGYLEGSVGATNFTTARPGVLAGPSDATANVPVAMACAQTGSGLNINIRPGAAVVERGSLAGSYTVMIPAFGTVTLGTADATNPRIDRVDLQVFDGALGDNGGVSITRYLVTTGTAAGSPAVPAAPANSIPLSQWLLPANRTTLTGTELSDKRKSAGIRGGIRMLLPGDALADVGLVQGEMRNTMVIASSPTIDMWSSVAGAWQRVIDLVNIPRTLVAGQNRVSSTGAVTTTETTVVSTTVSLEALTTYLLTFSARGGLSSTTVERWTQRIRTTSLTGTTLAANTISPNSDSSVDALGGMISYIYTTTTAQPGVVFLGTWVRASSTGSGTWTANTADNYITVERLGASSLMSTV